MYWQYAYPLLAQFSIPFRKWQIAFPRWCKGPCSHLKQYSCSLLVDIPVRGGLQMIPYPLSFDFSSHQSTPFQIVRICGHATSVISITFKEIWNSPCWSLSDSSPHFVKLKRVITLLIFQCKQLAVLYNRLVNADYFKLMITQSLDNCVA